MEKIKTFLLILLASKYISELSIFVKPINSLFVASALLFIWLYVEVFRKEENG